MTTLEQTTSTAIAAELVRARRQAGSPAMGMVMTLVVLAEDEHMDEALEAARLASKEHPARVISVRIGDGRGRARVDAEVFVGSHGWSGEVARITLTGKVTKHADSVVLPLLLPDSPVVVWWATNAPADPGADPLGQLAQRRITDAAAVARGRAKAMLEQCRAYSPGNTDLAWTRVTHWRGLLAAALDQHPAKVTAASVTAERTSPSADLLAAWLADRLRVAVARRTSAGPGITAVTLETREGPISLTRGDGVLATLSSPGQPDRPVALRRRELPDLLAEELRHLDEDDVYAATVAAIVKRARRRR